MIESITSLDGKVIEVYKTLRAGTILDMEDLLKNKASETEIMVNSIKNQTNLKDTEEIKNLDIETFSKISKIVTDLIENYVETKKKELAISNQA